MARSFWNPGLGHWFGLRPDDMGALTPFQLDACREFIEKSTKKGKG